MAKDPDKPIATDSKAQEAKLERLLLAQGFPRSTWPELIAQMSDAVRGELAALVDEKGFVVRGARRRFESWRNERIIHVRSAQAAKETGEHAGG